METAEALRRQVFDEKYLQKKVGSPNSGLDVATVRSMEKQKQLEKW
jgi:hypothetical protein